MNIIYHPWRVSNVNTSTRMHEYYLSSLTSSYHEHKHTHAWISFIILDEFLTWTQAHVCMNIMYHPWGVPNMKTSTRIIEHYLSSLTSSYHEHKHTHAWISFINLDEFLTWTQAHVCMNIMHHPWGVPNMKTSTRIIEHYLSSLTSS